jgi:hypothetical protein
MKVKHFAVSCGAVAMALAGAYLIAAPQTATQATPTPAADDQKPASSKRDTVAKPMTEKQKKKQEEKLRKELETPYRKWLNEDVAYIITD